MYYDDARFWVTGLACHVRWHAPTSVLLSALVPKSVLNPVPVKRWQLEFFEKVANCQNNSKSMFTFQRKFKKTKNRSNKNGCQKRKGEVDYLSCAPNFDPLNIVKNQLHLVHIGEFFFFEMQQQL